MGHIFSYPIQQNCYSFTFKLSVSKNLLSQASSNFTNNSYRYFISDRPIEKEIDFRTDEIS
ncbi:MAG: hypothetical protein ACFB02_03085 [Mastigocoleus sp.]